MEWTEIRERSDIDVLMEAYGGFHDSCITGIRYENGNRVKNMAMSWGGEEQFCLVMSLQRQYRPRDIELCFTGLRRLNLNGCDTIGAPLFDCFLSFYGPYIVWADGGDFDPEDPLKNYQLIGNINMYTFVVADRLKWRIIEQ